MDKLPGYKKLLSMHFGSRLHRDEGQTATALRWLAVVSLFIFLTLLVIKLLQDNIKQAVPFSIGVLPILVSLLLIRQGKITLASVILAVTLVLFVTWITSNANGIYDMGVVAYPVILIVAGLILPERFIAYLTALIVLCLGWLVFGATVGLYQPVYPVRTFPDDFFLASIIILIASNSVNLLVRNVHRSLERAEQEIEARKKLEKERELLIQELKLKNQELNRFAITVSHDLKTPLITISGYLGYLERDARTGNYDRLEKDITQINSAAKKMGRLVDQILDLSRIGRIINPPREVPFGEIVQEAVKLSEGPLSARQVKVRVEPELPIVYVDRVRLVQVVQNLITNGIKFMGEQPNPCIEIGMDTVNGQDTFFVRDNGIGIDQQDQSKIFELFNKLDPSTDGTGIGLALVQRIIEVHGGKIWVQSEPGKGSTFFFTLEDSNIKETT
jgi:signal transduction histidine kinase